MMVMTHISSMRVTPARRFCRRFIACQVRPSCLAVLTWIACRSEALGGRRACFGAGRLPWPGTSQHEDLERDSTDLPVRGKRAKTESDVSKD